ncbi:MAG: ABC-ATPase domain-containing protein, partial [Proteobacteria bacterium]|nr:ABC-ATPase domain-containing protein [Pseudomonadota bacterium]
MRTDAELASTLSRIDGRGYKAYQDLEGAFSLRDLTLFVDHVQGDPFAAPSKIRLRVPMAVAGLPPALFSTRPRRIALEDFLARQVRSRIGRGRRAPNVSGSGKSGLVEIDAGAQEVIERTALVITADWVEARLRVGLPAAGRRVLGRQADQLLCRALPELARGALCWDQLDRERAQRFVECVENQEHIRSRLDELGLVAFVANGSILPRESGASDRPLRAPGVAVAFQSPASLEIAIEVPNAIDESGTREIRGMGIPRGVTLVVGGGYHGKSTLLRAVERGVYPHIPGDGREYVVSSPGLAKIRAEDGRSVAGVDIASFIRELPGGRDTQHFQTDDASGSTSQAAALVEAVEAGATGLLLDEDTSATNFMVRDARMQALVRREDEPITPFL